MRYHREPRATCQGQSGGLSALGLRTGTFAKHLNRVQPQPRDEKPAQGRNAGGDNEKGEGARRGLLGFSLGPRGQLCAVSTPPKLPGDAGQALQHSGICVA